MRILPVSLLALLCSASAAAAPVKVHFVVQTVEAVAEAPAQISVKTKAMLGEILAARPELVVALDGAPDPAVDPDGFRKYAAKHRVAPYAVTVRISDYQRTLAPNDAPGKSGQILTIKLSLRLVGTKIPGAVLALAGSGGATVIAEVGSKLRPREEETTVDDALRAALAEAVDQSLAELRKPPPPAAKPPRSRKR